MRPRLTYANVMATVAVFIALGSGAYAAKQLPKNSVGSPQIKKNAVRTGDIARNAVKVGKLDKEAVKAGKLAKNAVPTNRLRDDAVTGAKVNEATLSTVPTATAANVANAANIANSLSPSEGWHEIGTPGEPPFQNSWETLVSPASESTAFYKDHEGIVHLRGVVVGGTAETVFALPPGYRPAGGKLLLFPADCGGAFCRVTVSGPGTLQQPGAVLATAEFASLVNVTFRAES